MGKITLVNVKTVVLETIDKRIAELNKEAEKYGEIKIIKKTIDVEKLKLSNLKTEICLNLDAEFEKEKCR